jgi:hypothetical protein
MKAGRQKRMLVGLGAVGILTALIVIPGLLAWAVRPGSSAGPIPLRPGLDPQERMTAYINPTNTARALVMYEELTGRSQWPSRLRAAERLDDIVGGRLSRLHWVRRPPTPGSGIEYHRDGQFTAAEIKAELEAWFQLHGMTVVPSGRSHFQVVRSMPKPP